MRNRFALLALFGLTAGLGGGEISYASSPEGLVARDLAALVQSAPMIIVGEVVSLQPGRTAGTGEGRLRFNDVRVRPVNRLKGEAVEAVVVEQVAMEGMVAVFGAGPPYRPGERYLLFLRRGEGTRHVTLPQGRYLLKAGRVHPTGPGPVADAAQDVEEAKFLGQIESLVKGKR